MPEPIILMENPYAGVNPHLNSELQTPGSEEEGPAIWHTFHTDHVTHIADFLNMQLPPRYVARSEQSLQVRTLDFESGATQIRRPEPDVSIYQRRTGASRSTLSPSIVPTWEETLEGTMDFDEHFIPSVVIRDLQTNRKLGRVVSRIELLSPSNKPPYSGYELYRKGRNEALYSGTPLIEVDYLHELPAALLKYPLYPSNPDAHAYAIIVNDPRPSISKGKAKGFGFDVDMPFPKINIPLSDEESLDFDFGPVYHHTFNGGRWGQMVDYAELPVRFETYSPVDQARIQARMTAIRESLPRESSN
jgi:Protein of unknown function (DUF4058)